MNRKYQMTFQTLGLAAELLKAVEQTGYTTPTPVQMQAIPAAIAGHDLLVSSHTGSGKTAAFTLPALHKIIDRRPAPGSGPRVLVLTPTRELALQVEKAVQTYGKALRWLNTACLVGGAPMFAQLKQLQRQCDVVVATPGRLLDHLERGTVRLDRVEELVLDEADHMLDLGFLPQIHRVLETLPAARHTMMFSATMPPPIARLTQRFLSDPLRVDITPPGRAAAGITHRLYLVDVDNKKPCILSLLSSELGPTLVFVRRRSDAEFLYRQLERAGHPVERIHADLSQSERIASLSGFREGRHQILIATDVAARGLDIPAIRHVVHYDLPDTVEDYVHRSGRTARGDATGIVSSIATWLDKEMIREIERALGQTLARCVTPGVEPYVERKAPATLRRRRLR